MSAPSFTHDVLIIGQGLAGAVLSETLALQGKRVCVFDRPQAGRSSVVAAGMVKPIVLRLTIPSWRASEMLAIAGAFYRELEMRYDTTFWHPLTLAAIFPTAQEAGIWQLRTKDPEIAPFLERESTADVALESLPRPYGHGVVKRCGWLDVQGFLDQHRARWSKAGDLVETSVAPSDHIPVPGGVRIHERSAPVVVYCEGPFSAYPGLVPVRGEGLTVRVPGLDLQCAVHRGVFLLPIGDQTYRVGATFAWDDVWSGPTTEARHYLTDRLERLLERPFEVVDHWAGVRPTSRDRRPIIGRIGAYEAVFNGLGSRGVLLAPWSAQHLTDHLFKAAPLDAEVDPVRFA